ncbi:two-component system response regulator TorR [Aestuariivirga sp.]|uniref:two-component system response regulator TorR n=1 Tax=Aestuariivirga sp. TaxID=2650926 RepID=UPI003919237F
MKASAAHIVVIEDDPVTRAKLAAYFKAEGYRVSEAEDGEMMRDIIAADPADLLMIDIQLPGEDGLRLTREQRERSDVGIILVTGRSDTVDRIVGLEIGADDYVTKPFDQRELLARVKNLLRRVSAGRPARTAAPQKRSFLGWTLDLGSRTLSNAEGAFTDLTRAEFKALSLLTANAGQVLSRDRLLHEIAHRDWDPTDRTVDVVIRRLRKKLGDDSRHPRLIVTSHGEGYLFAVPLDRA